MEDTDQVKNKNLEEWKQIELQNDYDLIFNPNELNTENFELITDDFNYIDSSNDLGFGLSEIDKKKELDELYEFYKEEMKNFINLQNIKKIANSPRYNFKLLNKSIHNFINFKSYIAYFKINKKDISNKKEKQSDNKIKENKLGNIAESESTIKIQSNSSSLIPNKDNEDFIFLKKRIFPKTNLLNIELKNKGKEYKNKVKNDFGIFLEYCFEESFQIDCNPSTSINFLYKKYEQLLEENPSLKNDYIFGNSINDIVVEFDILIKDIKKDNLLEIVKCFKSNIISSSNLNNLDNNKTYEIIGAVAQNILNQSIDKKTQISKYIDLILIDRILRENLKSDDIIFNEYNKLNLNLNDKMIMIFCNGSYVKLLKSYKESKEALKVGKNHNNIELQNIKNFRKIINLLENNDIPFIIFYIDNYEEELIEKTLLIHIQNNNYELNSIIQEEEKKIKEISLIHILLNQ